MSKMNGKALGDLNTLVEQSLNRSTTARGARLCSIDAADINFRKDLIRWLTNTKSTNSQFSEEAVRGYDWWLTGRASVICETVRWASDRSDSVKERLDTMGSWLKSRRDSIKLVYRIR